MNTRTNEEIADGVHESLSKFPIHLTVNLEGHRTIHLNYDDAIDLLQNDNGDKDISFKLVRIPMEGEELKRVKDLQAQYDAVDWDALEAEQKQEAL